MKIEPRLHISLSLPICFTLSAACAAYFDLPAGAAHSEPNKLGKPVATPVAAAKEPVPEATPVTLLSLIRSAKIFDTEYPVHVTLENKEATITTLRHPKATDQDCKIDAVLAAKTLMDTYPKEISRIKLVLSTSNSDLMHEVVVTTGDVKAYATGSISKEDLLTSLELKKSEPAASENESIAAQPQEGARSVVPGRLRSQRQLLAERIERLKAQGTGTQPFEEMFANIESNVPKVNEVQGPALLHQINDLSSHLYEQEEAYRSAQHIANGSHRTRFFQQSAQQQEQSRFGNNMQGRMPGGMAGSHTSLRDKIQELQRKGQNVTEIQQEWNRIHTMIKNGDFAGAEAARKALAQRMGMPPRGGNGGP